MVTILEGMMMLIIYAGLILAAVGAGFVLLGLLLLCDMIFKTHIGRRACKWLFNLE